MIVLRRLKTLDGHEVVIGVLAFSPKTWDFTYLAGGCIRWLGG
jgi:hypothetical protein